MTRTSILPASSCLLLALASSLGCVLTPAGLDGGLDLDEGGTNDELGDDGEADGDGDTTGETDGDGDTTGETTGEPEPPSLFECESATALDGSPAQLPASDCAMVCDDDFVGAPSLELAWSFTVDEDSAARALLRDPLASSSFYLVEQPAEGFTRLRWFDGDDGPGSLVELDFEGLYGASNDAAGVLYVAFASLESSSQIDVAAFDPESGERLWSLGLLDQQDEVVMAGADDGFAILTRSTDMSSSSLWRFIFEIPEPLWIAHEDYADVEAFDIAADDSLALASRDTLFFLTGGGGQVDSFPQGVDKLRVRDLHAISPTAFVESADGPELGASEATETVDALLTVQQLGGAFLTKTYRWGDLDCGDELVPGSDRFNAVALFDDGGIAVVGDVEYPFVPGEPRSLAQILELSPQGELVGGARLAEADTSATAVVTTDDSIFALVQLGAELGYQIRKYHRATP